MSRDELDQLLAAAKRQVDAMTPAEREAMLKAQAKSWARAELSWPKPRFHYENGVKVYESLEDYYND